MKGKVSYEFIIDRYYVHISEEQSDVDLYIALLEEKNGIYLSVPIKVAKKLLEFVLEHVEVRKVLGTFTIVRSKGDITYEVQEGRTTIEIELNGTKGKISINTITDEGIFIGIDYEVPVKVLYSLARKLKELLGTVQT